VRINGTRCACGFHRCLLETRIDRPLPGRIAITEAGDAPHLWLLRHGVLASRAAVPGFPAFEAALELGELVGVGAGPDEQREAINPHLPQLIERAALMMVEAADRLPALADGPRDRLTCLLLRAARKDLLRDRILALPLVCVADGSPLVRWLSLNQLVASGRGVLACDAPDNPRRGAAGDGAPVVLVSAEQRSLLADLLGIRLQQVPRCPRRFGLRKAAAALQLLMDRLSQLMWGMSGRRVVPNEDLLAAERELLDELDRQAASPTEVRMCAGSGPIRRRGRVLLLPRYHRLVAGSVRLLSDDEGWRYPVALALLGDRAGPLDELRDRWMRRNLALDRPGSRGRRVDGADPRRER
jgi:hypothetical protein